MSRLICNNITENVNKSHREMSEIYTDYKENDFYTAVSDYVKALFVVI